MNRQREESEPHHANVGDAEGARPRSFCRIVAVGTEQHGISVNQPHSEKCPSKEEHDDGGFEKIDHGGWFGFYGGSEESAVLMADASCAVDLETDTVAMICWRVGQYRFGVFPEILKL